VKKFYAAGVLVMKKRRRRERYGSKGVAESVHAINPLADGTVWSLLEEFEFLDEVQEKEEDTCVHIFTLTARLGGECGAYLEIHHQCELFNIDKKITLDTTKTLNAKLVVLTTGAKHVMVLEEELDTKK